MRFRSDEVLNEVNTEFFFAHAGRLTKGRKKKFVMLANLRTLTLTLSHWEREKNSAPSSPQYVCTGERRQLGIVIDPAAFAK
jgi:hypothetical protein